MTPKILVTVALAAGLTMISATPSSAVVTSVEFVPSTTCPGTDTTLWINDQTSSNVSLDTGYWMKESLDGVITYWDGAITSLSPGLYRYVDFSTWPVTNEWSIEIYLGDPRVPGSTLVTSSSLVIADTCPPEEEPEPLAATGATSAVNLWLPALGLVTVALGTLRFWRRKQPR